MEGETRTYNRFIWVLPLDPENNSVLEKTQNNLKTEEKAETANNTYTITQGSTNPIPPSMLVLPTKENTDQSHSKQPIHNMTRPHIQRCQEISPRLSASNRQRPHEMTTQRYQIHQREVEGGIRIRGV